MKVSIIVATDLNNAIGKENKLLWHLPADLKFFKNTTTGHSIIMGRKTFESIGRALPNRTNIIISRNNALSVEGCTVKNNLTDALRFCKENNETEAFVIGGGEIYQQAIELADTIYLTKVHHVFDADTFFANWDKTNWQLISKEYFAKDEKNTFDYSFEVWERK
jgi:dihydrofolate reductase